jgi:tetratricopeptide (TPR) repeat protein
LKTLVVPEKAADLQALLDNYSIMNEFYPALLEIPAGDFYVSSADWDAAWITERLNYVWDKDVTYLNTYQYAYQVVNYADVVLDELSTDKFKDIEVSVRNNIKGQALFFRGFAFYNIAQLFCKPYTSSATSDPGIPIRLTPNIEDKSVRSTVKQTYDQIIDDLKQAAALLPKGQIAPSRPDKVAAFGALARTYLAMRDYSNAGAFSDSALSVRNELLDFNTLDTLSSAPIPSLNTEVIFQSHLDYISMFFDPSGKIDTTLYNSYSDNDLRKKIFFFSNGDGSYSFKGSYDGTSYYIMLFNGIATDEMYLTRAESYARAGNTDSAMALLNLLLVNRWKTGTFMPLTANSQTDALDQILQERRKELVFRGLRWPDLRRLNEEGANITLKRDVDNVVYTLPPQDPRWVMLIPLEVINLTGMQQNPR